MFTTALTLICNPARPQLTQTLLADFRAFVESRAAGDVEMRILSAMVAADFLFTPAHGDHSGLEDAVAARLGGAPIDFAATGTQNRRKKLLIADMDSTIIEQECIDELADFAGKRAAVAGITERAMRGELDFEAALKERVKMLAGLPLDRLRQTYERRITLTPGARTLVQTMNKNGAVTALVSGGFTFFTERVGADCGFRINQANMLVAQDGALTGEVREPILGRAAKEEALIRIAAEHRFDLAETIAVGDGANDLSMLARAGLGAAFRAKPAVAGAARARINHGDLTALLYLQGFAQSDFVS